MSTTPEAKITIHGARFILNLPDAAGVDNDTQVQHCRALLREALDTAAGTRQPSDAAPEYVARRVVALQDALRAARRA